MSNETNTKRETQTRQAQKRRIPPGQPRSSLDVTGKDPNYFYYFASEEQVPEMLDGGYEFVTEDDNVQIGAKRETNPAGNGSNVQVRGTQGTLHYLMKIPKEWYEENQREKNKSIHKTNHSIHKGKHQTSVHNYVPDRGIAIDDQTKK